MYCYEISFTKWNTEYVCPFAYGLNPKDAIAHVNFWERPGEKIGFDYKVNDITVKSETDNYPFKLENAMRKAMNNKISAIHAILQSALDDPDKEDLIRSVVNDAPWELAELDTLVRDRFCTIMEEM